jgi:serine/threonine protein kinase
LDGTRGLCNRTRQSHIGYVVKSLRFEYLFHKATCISRSLGITIVEMLTAKAPYSDMTSFEFMTAFVQKTLTYNVNGLLVTKIGEPLMLLLTKMLQVDPSMRLKTGNEGAEMFGELGLLG